MSDGPSRAQLMIVGNDQKVKLENGTNVMQLPGHDTLSIVDISKPADLRVVATIPDGQHHRRSADQSGDYAKS